MAEGARHELADDPPDRRHEQEADAEPEPDREDERSIASRRGRPQERRGRDDRRQGCCQAHREVDRSAWPVAEQHEPCDKRP